MAKRSVNSQKRDQWTLEEIKNLISIINRNKIKEFDLEQGENKIRIVTQYQESAQPKQPLQNAMPPMVSMVPPSVMHGVPQPLPPPEAPKHEEKEKAKEEKPPPKEEKKKDEDENVVEVQSPMVGTFYRAPSPESPPYVQLGDHVNPDTVLCIVEAMKLMNEIKAEMSGTVVDILVENGQPVEYGQPMFKIKK